MARIRPPLLTRCLLPAAVAVGLWLAVTASAWATFPGQDGAIAFVGASEIDGFGLDVFAVRPDGSRRLNLTRFCTPSNLTLDPDWSPNGERLAYLRGMDGGRLETIASSGGTPTRLTPASMYGGAGPAWSPDGTKVAFWDSESDDIWVINANGTGLANITNTPNIYEEYPAWSPDGTKIAFAAGEAVIPRTIFVMDANGANRTQVTDPGPDGLSFTVDSNPDWSPDGGKIVYRHRRHGSDGGPVAWAIHSIGANGSGDVALTQRSQIDFVEQPSWSPSGTRIAFGADKAVWVMNADGSGQHTIATSGGVGAPDPDWGTAQSHAGGPCGTAAGGGTTRGFGARTRVTLRLAAGRIPAGGPVAVRIANGNGFTITGRLGGQTANRVSVSLKRRVRLKARAFRVGAHARKTVKLRLPAAIRRLLARRRRINLRLTAKVKDPAGQARTVSKVLTPRLKQPRRR